jgi:hypothetical protein
MCKISYKFVKNESYQIFKNICKLNLACLQVLFNKFAQNECEKNMSYQTMLIKSYKYVK